MFTQIPYSMCCRSGYSPFPDIRTQHNQYNLDAAGMAANLTLMVAGDT